MSDILDRILDCGVVAIIRAKSSGNLLSAVKALHAGGVTAIEVTMTTPGALEMIRAASDEMGNKAIIGAGTVLDPETARAAILSGAKFIVCPTLNFKTIELCKRYSIIVMPGAYTPTEILMAWEAGADVVKVFPADTLGPAFIKAVKAPLPQVKLTPTGGVDLNTTPEFIKAGADAVGAGSALVSQKLLDEANFAALTERAEQFRAAVLQGRAAKGG